MTPTQIHARFLAILAKASRPPDGKPEPRYADPITQAQLLRELRAVRVRGWKARKS